MAQILMFDDECSRIDLLFREFDLEPEVGERYIITVNAYEVFGEGRYEQWSKIEKSTVLTGTLIRATDDKIVLSHVITCGNEVEEDYFELVQCLKDDINKVSLFLQPELDFDLPYRLVLTEKEDDERRQKWLSVRYMGQMYNGLFIFLDYNNDKKIVLLNENDLKKVYPMKVDHAAKLEQAIVEGVQVEEVDPEIESE